MPNDLFTAQFERERAEQEVYARAHGYAIKTADAYSHYVYSKGNTLALCKTRHDAARIAYALAKTFPQEAKP